MDRLTTEKQPTTSMLPMVALRGLVAFPNMMLHFDVGRDRSIRAVEQAMKEESRIFAVAQRELAVETPVLDDLYTVGTIIVVKQILRLPDGAMRVLAFGESRGMLIDTAELDGVTYAEYKKMPRRRPEEDIEIDTMVRMAKEAFARFVRGKGDFSMELMETIVDENDVTILPDVIAANAFHELWDKQKVLECRSLKLRYQTVLEILERETQMQAVEKRIQNLVRESIDKNQKQYYLREQLRVIKTELGEDEEGAVDQLREQLEKSAVYGEAREMAERELRRMSHMAPGTPELSVSRGYLEFLLELPWKKTPEKPFKIEKARKILENEHFGLDKVKQRVLEYLAVRALNPQGKAPILCLVGAPGVGKTSVARSIANALNRKFVRMSLGGLHDEAEIRGHRRTYIGAMPGRILSLLRQCGADNPVFLLDEIDKLTSDMRGDPASALLEALDPEQNATFSDHYLEAPYDLSRVLFVTTANTSDTIPGPLLDRMELIEVPSYTLEEKVQIAKRHLLPKQFKEHALAKGQVKVSEAVLRQIIEGYTAEAGVRTLERQLQAVLRKSAVKLLEMPEEERKSVNVTPALLEEFLGVPYHNPKAGSKEPETGVVNGLAWTSIGGKTMPVEATVMPGSGHIELTGQLGDVMKESARTAYSYLRSHSDQYKIDSEFNRKMDLHIHVPEGAVPKDGPSAGVALTCAMLSAITGKPARQDVAMTGEITLRGKVLPIGGVKEKLLAAYRMGISTVLVPEENKKDLVEIPSEVRAKLDVHTISGVDQAISIIFDV
ncbi:MAG: endopeptidase La [Eubacteriales bacterium]|nr:endopeptidase La [Eubacteriales bacterium]